MPDLPTVGDLLEAVDRVVNATAVDDVLSTWADWWQYPAGAPGLISDITRHRYPDLNGTFINQSGPLAAVIDRLWLRQLPATAIAALLAIDMPIIDLFLSRTQRPPTPEPYHAQIVWARHCNGSTPNEIAAATGIPRSRVYRVISERGDGVTPNRTIAAPADRDTATRVAALYRAGKTYDEIRRDTGLSLSALKRLLSRLAGDGRLPEYGSRPGGRPTRNKETTTS